jgi:hypothetical protein
MPNSKNAFDKWEAALEKAIAAKGITKEDRDGCDAWAKELERRSFSELYTRLAWDEISRNMGKGGAPLNQELLSSSEQAFGLEG